MGGRIRARSGGCGAGGCGQGAVMARPPTGARVRPTRRRPHRQPGPRASPRSAPRRQARPKCRPSCRSPRCPRRPTST
eukprot:scaffold212435_cov15-Tisochrysis_lutea.AAC.1